MAGSVEMVWLGTATSLSALCFVVVLVMAKWWPKKAGAVGGGRGKSSDGAEGRLENQVKELEAAGDLDGAAALLLSAWASKGSCRAVTLAHELSQRYPEKVFQMGCPLQQGNRVLPAAIDSVAPTREQEHDIYDAGHGGALMDESASATTPAVSAGMASANAGIDAAPERLLSEEEGDERGSPSPSPSPSAALTPESAATGGGDAIAASVAGASPSPSGEANDERGGGVGGGSDGGSDGEGPSPSASTTDASKTTPWERGWQGPESFKPPPPSSSSSSSLSSSINRSTPTTPSSDSGSASVTSSRKREEAEEGDLGGGHTAVCRNFTVSQLNAFDGGVPAPTARGGVTKAKEARPIYIALRGDVYDVSAGRHLYGPGGEYSAFAGHDISRRVARGVGTQAAASAGSDDAPLDDLSLEGLDRFERMTLRGWEDMFEARGYPRVGRVVTPPAPRLFSRAELRAFDGRSEAGAASKGAGGEEGGGGGGGGAGGGAGGGGRRGGGGRSGEMAGVLGEGKGKGGAGPEEGEAAAAAVPAVPAPTPAGYAARPIYMGVRDKVFDVSFGGSEFYVRGGPYECLAGRDASRVLAKMSMKPEDVEGVLDYGSLDGREEKNLADWVEKLGEGEGGRGYPVVGWIDLQQ